MKKFLLMLILMMSFSVQAGDYISLENMSPGEKAQLLQQVEQIQQQKKKQDAEKNSTEPVVETVERFVSLGENIGKAFGGAAKEVGIAVNDFANTSVGKMTMALIVWNYVGSSMLSVCLGLFIFVVGTLFIRWWLYNNASCRISYNKEKTNIFGNHPIELIERDEPSSDEKNTALVVFCLLIAAILIFL